MKLYNVCASPLFLKFYSSIYVPNVLSRCLRGDVGHALSTASIYACLWIEVGQDASDDDLCFTCLYAFLCCTLFCFCVFFHLRMHMCTEMMRYEYVLYIAFDERTIRRRDTKLIKRKNHGNSHPHTEGEILLAVAL
uniref:Uncharacterized protein n=1 Tax=Parascaris univalens TaxID=6257 RepID=A0A915ALD5_PARUN